MANTTNFNWETPDDTDLVKDGAAAIRTLGSAIDTSLVDLKGGTTGQVLSKATNTDMDFTWVAQDDSNAIQNALLTTTGDTIYASGASTPARLGIGSTGQVLTVAGGVPTWATPAGGGGKVLQVVQATYSTQTSNSTSTYADTGLTANITPSSATSKVLVFYSLAASKSSGNSGNGLNLKLLRGATVIAGYESVGLGYTGTTIQSNFNVAQQYLDSPATTSATTYKLQFSNDTIQASVSVQHANTPSIITLMEIGA
jgi:hypothetical protein